MLGKANVTRQIEDVVPLFHRQIYESRDNTRNRKRDAYTCSTIMHNKATLHLQSSPLDKIHRISRVNKLHELNNLRSILVHFQCHKIFSLDGPKCSITC